MSALIRVDTQDGDRAQRGWLNGDKRHGLWIEQTPEQFTLTIYDDGEVRSQQIIAADDPAPFPIKALFERLKPATSGGASQQMNLEGQAG